MYGSGRTRQSSSRRSSATGIRDLVNTMLLRDRPRREDGTSRGPEVSLESMQRACQRVLDNQLEGSTFVDHFRTIPADVPSLESRRRGANLPT